ncbi:MAG: PIN domain-containing protein [Acidimicrobiales bacterium]
MISKLALDTNAYRALDDGNPDLARYVRAAAQIGLPVIVLGELYYGIFMGSRQGRNLSNLNRLLTLPRLELLHIDETTTKLFGEIATGLRSAGRPIQQDDMWIAALCKQHGFALATLDAGFDGVTGLETIRFEH